MTTQLEVQSTTHQSRLNELAGSALRGLALTYGHDGSLPYTMRWRHGDACPEGHSVRYALISLLGLKVGEPVVGATANLAETLWHRINDSGLFETLNAGDYGLGLWAASLHGRSDARFTAQRALEELRRDPTRCDSVDLAWLVLGAEHALSAGNNGGDVHELLNEAKSRLLELWAPNTSLFYRHPRSGLASSVSRRVACFANQVYPLMALSVHVLRSQCQTARGIAGALAQNLCRMQGPRGQWWWLYDAKVGGVVDGYPVYSVHQDGMALMGLLWAGNMLATDMSGHLDLSLRWVYGSNERDEPMVLDDQGLVLRDIHRVGVGRLQRMIGGSLHCLGRRVAWNARREAVAFRVNTECRPYHLGWILYAAGLARGLNTDVG